MNMKKTTPRYNKIKLLEKNDKEKILKSSQERSTLHSEEQK